MNIFLAAILVAVSFIAILIVVEYCKRRYKLSPEITRRVAHISAGLLALLAYALLPVWLYVIAISSVGFLIAYSQYKNVFTAIHTVKRRTYGELFLPIGLLVALLISAAEPGVYVASVLVLTLADSFGGLVSDLFKKDRKMLRGSAVFFVTTLIILLLTAPSGFTWYVLVLVSLIVTAVERYSSLGSDNLTVPAATALLLVLL